MENKNWIPIERGMKWLDGDVFPTMATPEAVLDVIDLHPLSTAMRMAAISLQGIINREKPRILTIGIELTPKWAPQKWFQKLSLQTADISLEEAITKYKSEINGIIIYDEACPHTMNLASTLAGLENGIVTNRSYAEVLTKEPFSIPVLQDYTGQFTDKLDVYRYLYDNLWERCNHRLFAGITPDIDHAYRDMGIATQSAFIFLDPIVEEDAEVLRMFAKDCKPGHTYYAGWWPKNEFGGLQLFGKQYGICTIATDFFYNMSVYAGMSKIIRMRKIPKVPKLENKIYYACMFSEGDNLQYDTNDMAAIWDEEYRGKMPITWSIAPTLYDAAPGVLNWYYQSATENDCFITGPSGVAFVLSETWEDESWVEHFTKQTQRYCVASGIKLGNVWFKLKDPMFDYFGKNCRSLWAVTEIHRNEELPRPMKAGHTMGITLVPGYARFDTDYESIWNDVKNELQGFDGTAPKFVFGQGITWHTTYADFEKLGKDIENLYGSENVEYIRGDQMVLLMRQYYGMPVNVAAQYLNEAVTIRVSDNQAQADKLNDGLYAAPEDVWCASAKGEQWIEVDLGKEMMLSRIVLMNAGTANFEKSLNTRDVTVLAGKDGNTWTTVTSVRNNEKDIIDVDVTEFQARFVRILIENPGADGIARLSDVELHGYLK